MTVGVPCPSDDTLGALVERALDESEAAIVGAHLDGCESCRAIVVAAVRGGGTPTAPRAAAGAALTGTRMGRYELRSRLGAGGMGEVYAAYDAELDRTIALKVLRPELARSATVLAERLVRESRLMAKVVHPSVITVHDVGRDGGAVFIAMELVRGETLGAYLQRHPAWRGIAAIFERAGQGLAAAHEVGIVHRDFKPENVLLELSAGEVAKVVVTDFGIAIAAEVAEVTAPASGVGDARLTATGAAIGTPAYMAPEQLAGGAVDRRADVFAFSVSLWEALFGRRPFPGHTVDEIRAAMARPLVVPRTRIPRRLIAALERGLAIDPEARWSDLSPLLAALAGVRSPRRRRIAIAAAGSAGLVGAGIAGALVLAGGDAVDPCARDPFARLATTELALDAAATQTLTDRIAAWRATQRATCNASRDPAQPPAIAACLDARRLEIEGFVDDARRDGRKAGALVPIMIDPSRCKDPPPGLAFSRVPSDPALRHTASELRYRAFEIESTRDRSRFDVALPQAQALVADSKGAWPPVHAEALYLLGTTQSVGGNANAAAATLREAAALADRTQHTYIAANSWIQLTASAAFDLREPARALEYAAYADAALDRLGRPPELEVLFLYHKATALVEADNEGAEVEAMLRRAAELAQRHAPEYVARTTMGLAYLFEGQGRYGDAVATYRRALAELEASGASTSLHNFRERLAINLSLLGSDDEAEREARAAVEIAEQTVSADSADRGLVYTTLAQVLSRSGKQEEALAAVRKGDAIIRDLLGDRSERRGEVLSLEGTILLELGRNREASRVLARACEIIAFGAGEDSGPHAECVLSQSIALAELGRTKEALALVDRGVDAVMAIAGEDHPRVATALVQRGFMRHLVGRTREGVADLERAIRAFEQQQLDPGHLGGAKWALGQVLWASDRARATVLIEEAIALFARGSQTWASSKADAETWMRTRGARR